jgi:hypothetical protein
VFVKYGRYSVDSAAAELPNNGNEASAADSQALQVYWAGDLMFLCDLHVRSIFAQALKTAVAERDVQIETLSKMRMS